MRGDAPAFREFALSRSASDECGGEKVAGSVDEDVVRSSQIGRLRQMSTPFGTKPLVYADWTASGRSSSLVENLIRDEVLAVYGNTHTASSLCGAQSSAFVAEARLAASEFVSARVSGKAAVDVVLFSGNGATSACCQLVSILGIDESWTVLVGPFEHHSNLLPWREAGASVVCVNRDSQTGNVDLLDLDKKLKDAQGKKIVGAFAAASNATGRVVDVEAVNELLNTRGALSVWDFATLAAHSAPRVANMDACFFSCHKFLGGPGAPGVLVLKKKLVDSSRTPTAPGGGTVFFATKDSHRFLSNRVEREQGGTPNITGIARAGAALDLARRTASSSSRVTTLSRSHFDRSRWPSQIVLLDDHPDSLPIFPIMIRCGSRFLHYHFVCQVLNDLFGIQCRGGCQCAGPYSIDLLGIVEPQLFERALLAYKDSEVLRPGYVRLSFGSTRAHNTQAELDYVSDALALVAKYGWRLLPSYRLEPNTGEWRHKTRFNKPLGDERKWLLGAGTSSLRTRNARGSAPSTTDVSFDDEQPYFAQLLEDAERLLLTTTNEVDVLKDAFLSPLDDDLEPLRWFVTPAEASRRMRTATTADIFEWPPDQHLLGPIRCGATDSSFSLSESARAALFKKTNEEERLAKKPLRGAVVARPAAATSPPSSFSVEKGEKQAAFAASSVAPPPPASKLVAKRVQPSKKLLKTVGEAMQDWKMINDGDRVLLGLSGGKDSLSLLHVLLHLQRVAPVKFELACATVDPVTPSFDPSPLIPYVEALGVKYFYLKDHIVDYAGEIKPSSLCSYCARMKRGALYTCALQNGYNVLALAQHLDDLAESFVMNSMHNGNLRTMRAKYVADKGVTVIRPLAYAREHLTADFAKDSNLPVINENCPACFEEPKQRQRTKKLLAKEESMFPHIFSSLKHCLQPLMDQEVSDAIKQFQRNKNANAKRSRHTAKGEYNATNQDARRLANFTDAQLRAELDRRATLLRGEDFSASSSCEEQSTTTTNTPDDDDPVVLVVAREEGGTATTTTCCADGELEYP